MDTEVIVLPANQPRDRFYRGGERIAGFRGADVDPAGAWRVPEDWVASTTCLAGEDALGLTVLPDGRRLVDAVAADPVDWLGPDHVRCFGADTRLLVKLLDAGQRLPVHAHPGGEFARRWLGRAHGKVEAWHMLADAEVHVGLRRPLAPADLRRMVESQDVDGLLGALHRRVVRAGDTVYVPAGTLHAIGEGAFLVELQEPEDLSVLLEWRDFELDGAADGHLGLGFDTALDAVDLTVLSEAEVDDLISAPGRASLPPAASAYFRLERVDVDGSAQIAPGYAVVVVVSGSLTTGDGAVLGRGTTAVVPHAAGPLRLSGDGTVVVCRPPLPAGSALLE